MKLKIFKNHYKKKGQVQLILMLLIVIGLMASCKKDDDKYKASSVKKENTLDGVKLKVDQDISIKDNGLISAVISNSTDDEYEYGESYILEYFYNNKWVVVESEKNNFSDVSTYLKKQSENELTYNIKENYKDIESGRYRIVQTIKKDGKDEYYLTAEFHIEDEWKKYVYYYYLKNKAMWG